MSFNLKKIFDKVEEETVEMEVNLDLPKTPFTQEDLNSFWDEFLINLKQERKIPSYNALQTAQIKLKENFEIEFLFSSLSTSSEFDVNRESLMLQMRKKFNNYSITFENRVDQTVKQQNFIKSKPEIFKEMTHKNPLLLKLVNEFGLDLNSND